MFSKLNSFRTLTRVANVSARRLTTSATKTYTATSTTSRSYLYAAIASTAIVGAYTLSNPTFNFCHLDYDTLRKELEEAIAKEDEKTSEAGTSIAPTLIRLAWHTSGTYSIFDKSGGSGHGSLMRFPPESEWGANAGLGVARNFLQDFAKKYGYALSKEEYEKNKKNLKGYISYGDLWTLAGAVSVEYLNGPHIKWRPGRVDATEADLENKSLPDGRLPNADMGCPVSTNSHIRDIFGRMGFNDQEIVALIGAHAVGRCHEEASGYWGPWNHSETVFSNQFFVSLLEEKWSVKKDHNGKPWKGPMQFESPDKQTMMLPADLWLTKDPKFIEYIKNYAKNEELFFKDFANAFEKLLELGVNFDKCKCKHAAKK